MAVPIPIIETFLNLIVNVILTSPELSHVFEAFIIRISLSCGSDLYARDET